MFRCIRHRTRPISRSRVPKEGAQSASSKGQLYYLVVDADGLPRDIKVYLPLSPEFDEAAIDAVKKWRFSPGNQRRQTRRNQIKVEVSLPSLLIEPHLIISCLQRGQLVLEKIPATRRPRPASPRCRLVLLPRAHSSRLRTALPRVRLHHEWQEQHGYRDRSAQFSPDKNATSWCRSYWSRCQSKRNEVYVVNTGSSNVSVIDAEQNKIVATIGVYGRPLLH